MSILFFTALNFGIGISVGILCFMAILHVSRGYRFTEAQERTVLGMIAFAFGAFSINLVSSSLLGTLQNFAQLDTSLPALAVIPLVTKFLAGVGFWVTIFWVMLRFYPSQKQK